MSTDTFKNIRLGIFVIAGTTLFIFSLYLIGLRKNVFGTTIRVSARFKNVNGLMEGNNVRFGGIDIGSIDRVVIASDTDILVDMLIEAKAKQHIRKNYLASIGTDGLMGNRLVNIVTNPGHAATIASGDMLESINPMETEEMLRAFNATGKNMKTITDNLNAIISKLKENNAMWDILGNKEIAGNIEHAISNFKNTGKKAEQIAQNLASLVEKVNEPDNLISVLTNPAYKEKINHVIDNIELSAAEAGKITRRVSEIAEKINTGEGSAALMLNDSVLAKNISQSIANLKSSTQKLDENLEALKHSFLLRSYFKRKK